MIYTSRIDLPIKQKNKNYVFLAGSIDLNLPSNWRKEVMDTIGDKALFLDPTITNHDTLNDSQMNAHISLVELGMYAKTKKLIVVCPNEFYKSKYIKTLCKKYNVPLFNTLTNAINYI